MSDAVVTYYLEQRAEPKGPPRPTPLHALIEEVERVDVAFYRRLYDAVGGPWQWSERLRMTDDELCALLHHPDVVLLVLRVDGEPAGFAELDARQPAEVEVKYFGLKPAFIGQGFGSFLLDDAVPLAWQRYRPRRVWLHTCTDDHPRALGFYQRHGFVLYRRVLGEEP